MAYSNPLITIVYERDFFLGVKLTDSNIVHTPIEYFKVANVPIGVENEFRNFLAKVKDGYNG